MPKNLRTTSLPASDAATKAQTRRLSPGILAALGKFIEKA